MNTSTIRFFLYSALILSLTVCLTKPSIAQSTSGRPGILVKYVSGISSGKKEVTRVSLDKLTHSNGSKPARSKQIPNRSFQQVSTELDLLLLDAGEDPDQFIQNYKNDALAKSGLILAIEPNLGFTLNTLPDDPDFAKQWGLKNQVEGQTRSDAHISAVKAWNHQTQGKGIVGIIDTGIDFGHPDLIHNIWQNLAEDADGDGKVLEYINGKWQLDPGDLDNIDADGNGYIDDLIGWDFINDDNNPYDDHGHGTHIAGIIGAEGDNSLGITGVVWSAEIMALKAFNEYGYGSLSDILPALEYARKMGVLLTNNSWGGNQKSEFLLTEILAANNEGQIFVAAAGNGGYFDPNEEVYPANYDAENILSVTASDDQDQIAGFASISRQLVDLAAPGEKIYSTLPEGLYGYKSGTSMAAGYVSGAVLLLKGANPNFSITEIISRIQLNVDVIPALYGTSKSNGRLNLLKALQPSRNRASAIDLFASFDGPSVSCTQQTINFVNTSVIAQTSETDIEWFINGQFISSDIDLNYAFQTPGWNEIKLVLSTPTKTSEYMLPLEISLPATANLGPDTSICAPAYLIQAGVNVHQVSWKLLNCPDNTPCVGAEDFTTLDPLHFNSYGGQTQGFVNNYIITNEDDQILLQANTPDFPPISEPGMYSLYSIHHWPGTAVRGMEPGDFLRDIDLGPDSCSQISPPHKFQVWEAIDLGSHPYISAKKSGIYILNVTDPCGNKASDTLNLTLYGTCVWPGDVNTDGKVSIEDFLCLGIAANQTGPVRDQASTSWSAQAAQNWSSSFHVENAFASEGNLKHADINGDGIVDMNLDLQGLQRNIGFFHDIERPVQEDGPSFYIEHLNTTFSSDGDTAKIKIGLFLDGKNNTIVEDIYGMAFNLSFSDPVAIEPKILPTDTWLGPMNHFSIFSDNTQSGPSLQNSIYTREKFGFGMISSSDLSYSGRGLIASGNIIVIVDDIVEDTISSGYSSFGISAQNIVLIDKIGRIKGSLSPTSLNTFEIGINWPSPPIDWYDFKAWVASKDILLEWGTFGERQLDLFQVERSIDGRIFERIGEVPAQAHEEQSYTFRDVNAVELTNQEISYRIRRLDKAGHSTFSETLRFSVKDALKDNLWVYPNPLKESFNINYSTLVPASASISIINGLGQEIQKFPHLDDYGKINIKSIDWPAGIYFIRLHSELGTQVVKTVKH